MASPTSPPPYNLFMTEAHGRCDNITSLDGEAATAHLRSCGLLEESYTTVAPAMRSDDGDRGMQWCWNQQRCILRLPDEQCWDVGTSSRVYYNQQEPKL